MHQLRIKIVDETKYDSITFVRTLHNEEDIAYAKTVLEGLFDVTAASQEED